MSSFNKRQITTDRQKLISWYEQNKRDLPWRKTRDPYPVWLSEIMLQQTTVKAVIPYYKKFLKRFRKVEDLAQAQLEDIYELWAGLGYYSRARSLHKAAQEIAELGGFPETHKELIKLPGFGDYTSRSVASLAFAEPVGVVDGNVIRVLSRRWGKGWSWWKSADKKELQQLADAYASDDSSSQVNQGLMELGATICTPKNPTCFLCPWQSRCLAYKNDSIADLPLSKPKRATEIWQWQALLIEKQGKIAFVKNNYAPFLKGQWLLPGKAKLLSSAPSRFDFKHGITHHKIFVSMAREKSNFVNKSKEEICWISPKQLKQKVPFSLVQKAVALGLDDRTL